MPGIFQRLGSFGQRIIKSAISTGRTILETVGFIKPIVPTIDAADVAHDYGQVQVQEEYSPEVKSLGSNTIIPDSLHAPTDIPFKRPFAYKVVVFGRYVAGTIRDGVKVGGRFAKEEYDLPSNRKLTKAEIMDMAKGRLGKKGGSPIMVIFSMQVVEAYSRE